MKPATQVPSKWVAPIIWGAMIVTVLVYGLVAHLVRMPGPIPVVGTIAGVLSTVSLAVLVVQYWVWSRLADDVLFPRTLGKLRQAGGQGRASAGASAGLGQADLVGQGADSIRAVRVTTCIIVWALSEAIAVFGLVLSLIGADPRWFYPIGAVALADLLWLFPRWQVEEEQVRRWGRYAAMRGLGS